MGIKKNSRSRFLGEKLHIRDTAAFMTLGFSESPAFLLGSSAVICTSPHNVIERIRMKPAIEVDNLSKEYVVSQRTGGLTAAVRGLFRRDIRRIQAVDRIRFTVEPGEMVGFLGPNGAGKTTTLKMLSGLLHPTDGDAHVLGYRPWRRERDFLGRMALVMGQRNQLIWDIPALDTFELLRAIYRVPKAEYRATLAELDELLELGDLLQKPVRNLSLGERMKCEIAGALIHRPKVLFLDEPTIGLDVTMQRRIRSFLRDYNATHGATVLLTSHYMADVEALCRRVIVIHHGRLLFDGDLRNLVERFSSTKTIAVKMPGPGTSEHVRFEEFAEVLERGDGWVRLRVERQETAQVTARLLAELPILDLTVEDPPLEDTIEQVFSLSSETLAADDEAGA
jgi:ABC-2 type transport system ATP-binding protein